MTLPVAVVERLFKRLAVTYGAAWEASLGGAPINDIKSLWSYELGAYEHRLDELAWAIENLPERPPNVVQFKLLVRQAPRQEEPQALPAPRPDPAKLAQVKHAMAMGYERAQEASRGKTPAQDVVDGLIQRAKDRPLGPAQVHLLRACCTGLHDTDPRLSDPVVVQHVPRRQAQEA